MAGLQKAETTELAKYELVCKGVQFEQTGHRMGSRF
jgi:hypothetical protein